MSSLGPLPPIDAPPPPRLIERAKVRTAAQQAAIDKEMKSLHAQLGTASCVFDSNFHGLIKPLSFNDEKKTSARQKCNLKAKQAKTVVPSTVTEVAAVAPVSAAPTRTTKNGTEPASVSLYEPLYKSEIGGRAASTCSTIDDVSASISGSETSPAVAAPTKVALDKHRALVRAGMDAFRACNVVLSLKHFDEAIATAPSRKPFMWQRGLSLYYLGRFDEAATQFRIDVAVNPNDTEEAIWAFISEKKLGQSVAKPLLRVGLDTRAVMRSAYALFESEQESATEALAAYTRACTPAGDSTRDSLHDEFYAQLYLGLHAESQGHVVKARAHITAATATAYGCESKDYMAALARVHMQVRGWTE